jgi:hypothetical protein
MSFNHFPQFIGDEEDYDEEYNLQQYIAVEYAHVDPEFRRLIMIAYYWDNENDELEKCLRLFIDVIVHSSFTKFFKIFPELNEKINTVKDGIELIFWMESQDDGDESFYNEDYYDTLNSESYCLIRPRVKPICIGLNHQFKQFLNFQKKEFKQELYDKGSKILYHPNRIERLLEAGLIDFTDKDWNDL